MSMTTDLYRSSLCKTASGTHWPNRWTYQTFIMNTRPDGTIRRACQRWPFLVTRTSAHPDTLMCELRSPPLSLTHTRHLSLSLSRCSALSRSLSLDLSLSLFHFSSLAVGVVISSVVRSPTCMNSPSGTTRVYGLQEL